MSIHDEFMELVASTNEGRRAIECANNANDDSWEMTPLPVLSALRELKELPPVQEDKLVDFQPLDLPVMVVAGVLGALTSAQLQSAFSEYHDKKGSLGTLKGGHAGELIDKVPGRNRPGGFGHRLDYGHDILNPFEVDWSDYLEKARSSGSSLSPYVVAAFYWLRHLFHDSFSKEGLPIPLSSLFRGLFATLNAKQKQELSQALLTNKARDVVGSGVSNLVLQVYLMATEVRAGRKLLGNNWRTHTLRTGANLVTVLVGLCFTKSHRSLNWSALTIAIGSGVSLARLSWAIEKELQSRRQVLNENAVYLTQVNDESKVFDREFQKYLDVEEQRHSKLMSNN